MQSTSFLAKALCEESRQEPEVVGRKVKMAVARERKTGNVMISLSANTKTGDFNQQRTLSGSFFVIPKPLASGRAVFLAFTVNKQTNTLNYIYRFCLQREYRYWRNLNLVVWKSSYDVIIKF